MRAARSLLVLMIANLGATGLLSSQPSGARTYDVDPSQSTATIEVGKSGPLSFVAGHTHDVEAYGIRGIVHLSAVGSDVDLTIPVSAMKVNGAHESAADLPKI